MHICNVAEKYQCKSQAYLYSIALTVPLGGMVFFYKKSYNTGKLQLSRRNAPPLTSTKMGQIAILIWAFAPF